MAPTKRKKKIKYVADETVADALKKGLVPYVDFYPIPKAALKKIPKSETINLREHRQDKWENIEEVARSFYETPGDAIEILVKHADIKQKELSTYILCCHLVCDARLKENKNLPLNKMIDNNLEFYCKFIGVPYSEISSSVREMQKAHKEKTYSAKYKKYERQKIIDRIVERYRRTTVGEADKFKKWMHINEAYYRGPF